MKFPDDINIVNRKARHEYEFVSTLVAGIALQGTEIKSIRLGKVNMSDAFCDFTNGELFVHNLHISEYKYGTYNNHDAKRSRKLLLKKYELRKLYGKVREKGFTIVPYRMFISNRGHAKLKIALARGKKSFDKSASIKDRDIKRDMNRAMKNYKF